MGILVDIATGGNTMTLRTDQGYLFKINTSDGRYHASPIIYLYFKNGCEGQAYVKASDTFNLSGRIFQIGQENSHIFARTEWGEPVQSGEIYGQTAIHGRLNSNGTERICEHQPFNVPYIIPATEIPIPEGVPDEAGNIARVFARPFTAKVERSNAMFCNGFESCPTK
jgi:hypothetical protein